MNYKQILKEIKYKMNLGIISYYEARNEAQPYIDEMNVKGKEIAIKYGQKFKPFTFQYLMR